MENNLHMSLRRNGLSLSTLPFNRITRKEIRWYPYQIRVRQQFSENDSQRKLKFSYWLIRIYQNNRFIPNIVNGDEGYFTIDGTVSTYNVRMWTPKSDKPKFRFQINNSRQKVTVWDGLCGNCTHTIRTILFSKKCYWGKLPQNIKCHNSTTVEWAFPFPINFWQ